MQPDPFVPVGFEPPTSLETEQFRLEPLGLTTDWPWERVDRCGR